MGGSCKLIPTWRALAVPLLALSLGVVAAWLSGCAGERLGSTFGASLPECVDQARWLPFSHTYPCNVWSRGGFLQ